MGLFENHKYEEDEIIGYCELCSEEIVDGNERFPHGDGICCLDCCIKEQKSW